MQVDITQATEADIPVIANILTEAKDYKVAHGDTVWGTASWTNDEVQERMTNSTAYLVRLGEEVVGTVSLQWDDELNWGPQPQVAGYMHRLAIKNSFHGHKA